MSVHTGFHAYLPIAELDVESLSANLLKAYSQSWRTLGIQPLRPLIVSVEFARLCQVGHGAQQTAPNKVPRQPGSTYPTPPSRLSKERIILVSPQKHMKDKVGIVCPAPCGIVSERGEHKSLLCYSLSIVRADESTQFRPAKSPSFVVGNRRLCCGSSISPSHSTTTADPSSAEKHIHIDIRSRIGQAVFE